MTLSLVMLSLDNWNKLTLQKNYIFIYRSKYFMYHDCIVILPFLDFFSFVKSAVCMNSVQVSGRHRLNYDCDSRGDNTFSESPRNMHMVLGLEALGRLHFLNNSITTFCWNPWVSSGLQRWKPSFLNSPSSKYECSTIIYSLSWLEYTPQKGDMLTESRSIMKGTPHVHKGYPMSNVLCQFSLAFCVSND